MAKSAGGAGSIRKKTVTRDGKTYSCWEGRVTVGYDPGTGKQIRRSFSGKTQKEVRAKIQQAAVELAKRTIDIQDKMAGKNADSTIHVKLDWGEGE